MAALSVTFTEKLGSFIKRQTSGTSSDNEWQRVVQRVTTNDNEWQQVVQRVTKSENEWQRVTTNGNEWQQVRAVVQRLKTAHSPTLYLWAG